MCLHPYRSYPPWKSQLFYAALRFSYVSVWFYHIFPHYHTNGRHLEKGLLNIKCIFIVSTTCVWKVARSKKNWVRCKASVINQILMKIGLDYFRKIIKRKISWKYFQWVPSCSMRTDGINKHDKANSFFPKFCVSA